MFLHIETAKIAILEPPIEPTQGPCGSESEKAQRDLRASFRIRVRQTVYVLRSWRENCADPASALKTPTLAFADFHSDDGDCDRHHDDTANDSEGNSRRNVYPRVRQHFGADEHEHDGEAFVEILKIREDSGQ